MQKNQPTNYKKMKTKYNYTYQIWLGSLLWDQLSQSFREVHGWDMDGSHIEESDFAEQKKLSAINTENVHGWVMEISMSAEDDSGELEDFYIGNTIVYMDDSGLAHEGVISDMEDGLLYIKFEDGEEGWERPDACYRP
jgi:hypothetical protein